MVNRFDAERLLLKLRDKRLAFVGDSLNRNQWVSMVCLIDTGTPKLHKSMTNNGSLVSFKIHVSMNASSVLADPWVQTSDDLKL